MQQVLHVAKKNNSLVLIDEAYYLFYKNSFINYIKNGYKYQDELALNSRDDNV